MNTNEVYTLDLTFSSMREKSSEIQTIKVALDSWKALYGENYVNYSEGEIVVGKIFGIISVYNKNITATLPERLMRQTLGVLGKTLDKTKYVYIVDLIL